MLWKTIHCELLELLGEGHQGRVYKALRLDRSSGLKQFVAIKVLHSKTAVSQWRQEFESLARVRSPFCVHVHSFERLNGRPALVLEYVEGVSLLQLGRSCWLESEEIQEILAQIECALADLQRFGVFHGDLSPQNVLIDVSGRVRLLDFGLANLTQATPEFSAPERLQGAAASHASDLFSLGKIEEFLRGFSFAGYICEAPSDRRAQDLSPCSRTQERLAEKIGAFRERQALNSALKTQTHALLGPKPGTLRALFMASITAILFLFVSQASQIPTLKRMGALFLHTRQWHYFLLDGKPLGYSPIALPVEAGRRHRIEWISAHGRGVKTVSLQPLENRRFGDSDFSH